MTGAQVITFGCRLNAFESEVIRGHARAAQLDDTVIVNSCAVTAEAERQVRQAIRRARRAKPGARIVVTGCAAQLHPEDYAAMPEVDLVLGNGEKLDAEAWRMPGTKASLRVADVFHLSESAQHLIDGFEARTRAFIQVQNGCDHRCTFCIIPFARGASRSVPVARVIEQVERLVDQGVAEVVLTGVDLTSYGADLPAAPGLGELVRAVLEAVSALPRLRLSSIDPAEVDDALKRTFAEQDRLLPHVHLSLQAGDDLILKRMKRRHSRAQAIALCGELRDLRPGIVFGADLIAGFPTESEAMFRHSLDLVAECGLTHLHVFPYSERPGTPAARMPAVPVAERKARAARLRDAGADALAAFLESRIGAVEEVLVEDGRRGRSAHFAPVTLSREMPAGDVVSARTFARQDGGLLARPLQAAA